MAYATVNEADTYLATIEAWTNATADQKSRALDAATIALDAAVDWNDGDSPTDSDALDAARDACCELAVYDIGGTLYPAYTKPQVVEEQLGSMRRKYRSSGSSRRGHVFDRFPKVGDMLADYATRNSVSASLLLRA